MGGICIVYSVYTSARGSSSQGWQVAARGVAATARPSPSLAARTSLIEYLQSQGFDVGKTPGEPDDQGMFSVAFTRADKPELIDDVVVPLHLEITELGGNYDGWGCNVATAASQASDT